MLDSNRGEGAKQAQNDFQRALRFYSLVVDSFGQQLGKHSVNFPQKYDRKEFARQFQELDDVQRILWCDHNLKEAFIQYDKREREDIARKNIWFTLAICSDFKIKLTAEYQLFKMIKRLWLQQPTSQSAVKDKLNQIFQALGESTSPVIKKPQYKSAKPDKKTSCGCGGDKCIIF